MQVCVGQKYYYYENDSDESLNVFQILKVRRKEVIGVLNGKSTIKVKQDTLKNYTLIKPDGYLTISIVELGDKNEDVIVTLCRKQDGDGVTKPFAICRQGIADVFGNQILKDDSVFLIGTSVNADNCPTNVDFNMVSACDKIKSYKIVACYSEDSLEKTLSLIDTKVFDETLFHLYNKSPNIIKLMGINLPVYGFCKSLKELLEFNDFEYDYLKAFNINKVPFKLEIELGYDNIMINSDQLKYLEDIANCHMINMYIMKYDKTINLNLVKRNYIMISDSTKQVYIIAYDSGEHLDKSQTELYKYIRDSIFDAKKKMSPIMAYNKNKV